MSSFGAPAYPESVQVGVKLFRWCFLFSIGYLPLQWFTAHGNYQLVFLTSLCDYDKQSLQCRLKVGERHQGYSWKLLPKLMLPRKWIISFPNFLFLYFTDLMNKLRSCLTYSEHVINLNYHIMCWNLLQLILANWEIGNVLQVFPFFPW